MTSVGSYLKSVRPDIINLGVSAVPDVRVPVPHPIDTIQSELPWQEVVTREEHVTLIDSYAQSLQLCHEGIICGPVSGLALRGLYQFLEKEIRLDVSLSKLRGPDGYVSCASFGSCHFQLDAEMYRCIYLLRSSIPVHAQLQKVASVILPRDRA